MRGFVTALVVIAVLVGGYYLYERYKPDPMAAFAKCTAQKGAKMYGAFWCPHCKDQKESFGKSFQFVNYVECAELGAPKVQLPVCKQANILHYPTWEFSDKSRLEGPQTMQTLSEKTGCPLP